MVELPLSKLFTAKEACIAWNNFSQNAEIPHYLGRTFFGTDKKYGFDLQLIKGRKGLPIELKKANFDVLTPLRNGIGFTEIQSNVPFLRKSYTVEEKYEQEYMNLATAQNSDRTNQILKELMKKPIDMILEANVIPERMIWQLLAPVDGIPKITVFVDGGKSYNIDYTGDNGAEYKSTNFIEITTAADKWSAAATATPIDDLVKAQEQHMENSGEKLSSFIMNYKTFKMLVNAEDTHKQIQGAIAYTNGIRLKDNEVKSYLRDNYGIIIDVYDKCYIDETEISQRFIPDGVVTAIAEETNQLGTVWYGTTPEERSGSLSTGNLAIVDTGVSIYTYTTPHPINTHCVVSEIVLPSYENMDSVVVMKVS